MIKTGWGTYMKDQSLYEQNITVKENMPQVSQESHYIHITLKMPCTSG